MTSSIIVDWAFAHAVRVTGAEMVAFLEARETMRRAQRRDRGLGAAIAKAGALGRWARAYFMPDLAETLRTRAATEEAGAVMRILHELVDGEERDLRDILVAAIQDSSGGADARGLVQTVELAADRWLATENPANFSVASDFTDIEVFIAPALLLILATLLVAEGTAGFDDGAKAMRTLRAKALDGSYGRFPFLLAIDLILARPQLAEPGAIEKALLPRGPEREKLLAAPEILARLVKWRFCAASETQTLAATIDALAQELRCFTAFRKMFDPARAGPIRLALWLDAVVNLMLDVDGEAAAGLLAELWTPQVRKVAPAPAATLPIAKIPATLESIWQRLSQARLAKSEDLALAADPAAEPGQAALLLSPWMPERSWARQSPVERLRWLSGLSVDIRLLETFALRPELEPFALHLLASVEELRRYAEFKGNVTKPWRSGDVTEVSDLGWLCGQIRSSALKALSGEGRAGLPQLLDLLERATDADFDFPGVDPLEVDRGLAQGLRRRLATSALRLVEHSMSTNWRGWEAGWLGAAGRVLDLHAPFLTVKTDKDGRSKKLEPDDVIHGLIARYGGERLADRRIVDRHVLDEVSGTAESPGAWDVAHRCLFLAPLDEANRWVGPGDPVGAPKDTVRLVRALMRVASASRDESFSRSIAKEWRADLLSELRKISEPREFDRFARFQLIEMIGKGVFDEDEDDELLRVAVAVSVSFGGTLHLREIIGALMSRPAVSGAAVRVRMEIFGSLSRVLGDLWGSVGARPLDPRTMLLDQLKAACLFACRPDERDLSAFLIESARKDPAGGLGSAAVSIRLQADGAGILRVSSFRHPWIAPGTAGMIAVDTAQDTAWIVQAAPPAGTLNAFAHPPAAERREGRWLGVVEEEEDDPRAGRRLEILFAPDKRVRIDDPAEDPAAFGDLVVVDAASPQGPDVQDAGPPRTVKRIEQATQNVGSARVEPQLRPGRLAEIVVLADRQGQSEWARASSNFAWLAQPEPPSYTIRLAGSRQQAGGPALMSLSDLLVERADRRLDSTFTLAVQEPAAVLDGGVTAIIFESLPLRHYLIPTDFALTDDCRHGLSDEFARLAAEGRNPRGLLVTFRLVATPLGPQLDLVSEPGPAGSDPAYPELRLPFDERNLWWRDPFGTGRGDRSSAEGGEIVWSRFERPFYTAELDSPPPGFPSRFRIKVEGRNSAPEAFVELALNTWNPWEGSLFGTLERSFDLKLPADREDRAAEIRGLEALRTGSILTLFEPTRTIRDDGRVYCRTKTNLSVLVNAETVSMRVPFEPVAGGREGREAILVQLDWRARGETFPIPLSEIPPEAISDKGLARGFLTAVPVDPNEAIPCRIAWLSEAGPEVLDGVVMVCAPSGARRTLRPASRIDARIVGNQAVCRLREPFAVADALWRQAADDGPGSEGGDYIGSLIFAGAATDAYEVGNGRFALRHNPSAHSSPRQSLQSVLRRGEDQSDLQYVAAIDRNAGWSPGRSLDSRRCALIVDGDTVAGATDDDSAGQRVRVTGLHLRRLPAPGNYFRLSRHFHLAPEVAVATLVDVSPRLRQESAAEPIRLPEGKRVTGRFDPRRRRFQLNAELRRAFPDGVIVEPEHLHRAPLGPNDHFPGPYAAAKVLQSDPLALSFLGTDPAPLEELHARLVAARIRDQSSELDAAEIRIIFVGLGSRTDEETGKEAVLYRFEWGYGLWTELPESQVRYRGESIDRADLRLFFGDRISAAELIWGEEEPYLDIAEIVPSRAQQLYRHGKKDRVVNLLEVVRGPDGRPVISAIRGFDPYAPEAFGRVYLPHARLDPDSETLLRERLEVASPQNLLGRLDIKSFEASGGERLIFRRARLDLQDEKFGLRPGDRCFVEAGRIVPLPNDVGLRIHPPRDLHGDDIGRAFLKRFESGPLILRRNFSLREQTLRDFLALDGPDALQDRELMVTFGEQGGNLKSGSLPRNPEVLRQLLRMGHDVVATFGGETAADDADELYLHFELQPGVVVGLRASEVEGAESLLVGDQVRLRSGAGGRLLCELASWSDFSFVRDGRPAVILPRQHHAQAKAIPPYAPGGGIGFAQRAFSVGDLPSLTVAARNITSKGPKMVGEKALVEFMSSPHPKFGELHVTRGEGRESGVVFSLGLRGRFFPGRLAIGCSEGGSPTVEVEKLEGRSRIPTDWYLVSYRDRPAVEVKDLALHGEWRFHDMSTTTWRREAGGSLRPSPDRIPAITPARGPLFFTLAARDLATLRHPRDELVMCATGLGALLPPLFEYGAVSTAVARFVPDGLLVEPWPGRIVLVPGGVSRHLSRDRSRVGNSPVRLRAYDWEAFGPGDELIVRTAPRASVLAPIELDLEWSQGPRNAFGPAGALLGRDLRSDRPREGSATFGLGRMQVVIPSQDVASLPDWAIVGGPGHLTAPSRDLSQLDNCTILLCETRDQELAVHGLPGVNIVPDRDWDWQHDSLMRPVVRETSRGLFFTRERLLQLVRLAGGALPFTVEKAVKGSRPLLFLSRRHQRLCTAEGSFVLATADGEIGSSDWMQLRVGGRHLAVHGPSLCPGIPPEDLTLVFRALADSGRPIWLTMAGHQFRCGHSPLRSRILTVAPVSVVGRYGEFVGVICEGATDGRLYWLPAAKAAACDLSAAEAEATFASPQLARLQVANLADGTISILDHPRAVAELAKLELGALIFVDLVKGSTLSRPFWEPGHVNPEWTPVIVLSKQTSVLFAAVVPAADAQRDQLQAEVAVRKQARCSLRIMLNVAGERLAPPAIPSFLLDTEAVPWRQAGKVRYLSSGERFDDAAAIESLEDRQLLSRPSFENLASKYVDSAGEVSLLLGLALAAWTEAEPATESAAGTDIWRTKLVRNLFARCLRSLPLEHLAAWRLNGAGPPSLLTAFWYERTRRLFLRGNLEEARRTTARWLSVSALEGVKPEEEALANAFGVFIGTATHPELLTSEARFLPRIIAASRPVCLATNPRRSVIDESTVRLRVIALDLVDFGYDIPLAASITFE